MGKLLLRYVEKVLGIKLDKKAPENIILLAGECSDWIGINSSPCVEDDFSVPESKIL